MRRQRVETAIDERRLREASRWFVRHESEDELSQSEWQEWEAWSADPQNSAEFDACVSLQRRMKASPKPQLPSDDELVVDVPDKVFEIRPTSSRVGVWTWATASALAACLLAAVIVFQMRAIHSTSAGEQRAISLPDGSTVLLGGRSAVSVRFTASERALVLDRGQALFTVVPDPARPFRVFAGEGTITALGTAFDVLNHAGRVTVSVIEGSVAVASQESVQPVRLARGQGISYEPRGKVSAVEHSDPQTATAWSRGTLVYRRQPLSEVIEDVRRYTPRRIDLDPSAADLLYSGTVGQQHIDAWLQELPGIFPLEVVEVNDERVSIRLREDE